MQKMRFFEEKKLICFSNAYYSEILKNGMWSCAPSHGKWNKITKFVLSVKLWDEIGFLQDPQKAYIFYAIRFLYVSQKKSRNKLCLEPHEHMFCLERFSLTEIFFYFLLSADPLKVQITSMGSAA